VVDLICTTSTVPPSDLRIHAAAFFLNGFLGIPSRPARPGHNPGVTLSPELVALQLSAGGGFRGVVLRMATVPGQ
jgi:hypothetical protein